LAGAVSAAADVVSAAALATRGLRTRFSAVSPASGVLSDKQGILAKRRALAGGERDVWDVVMKEGCGAEARPVPRN
jgi:hypothetical protein